MTDLRTAAQQALDYWESASFGDAVMVDKMDALRAALAEPVQEPVAWLWPHQLAELQEWKNEGNIRAWSGRGPKPDGVVPVYTAP